MRQIVEGCIPDGWKEKELEEGNHYLSFQLLGALIIKSQLEKAGVKAIVVKVDSHYEVHKLVRCVRSIA